MGVSCKRIHDDLNDSNRKEGWRKEWEVIDAHTDSWGCTHYKFRHRKSGKMIEIGSGEGLEAAADDLRYVPSDVKRK
ncbi:hypothetical protein C6499_19120 [Candidatus Poribacteria bacterium]|nr:MAG: hypothetical protein C6499_19120 [Candidatus Poribacteria bacterium]